MKARLTDQRCLLIAQDSRDRNSGDHFESCFAVDFAARSYFRQHRAWNVKRGENLRIPIQSLQIQKLRAASVRHVGNVHAAFWSARQIPQKKGVNISEEQFAADCFLPYARNTFEQPV